MATRKKKYLVGAGAAAVVAVALATVAGAADQPRRPQVPDQATLLAAVADGSARPLPPSPADLRYSSFWQGCRFVLHVATSKTYQTDQANIVVQDKPTPVDAPGPPCDVERQPTDQEIAAMKAQVDALNNAHRPAGAPPLPASVPDVPRTGQLGPGGAIPAR